ncbi:MAG: hypothetical protein AAF532_12835 [Planctomycetota bacterium]
MSAPGMPTVPRRLSPGELDAFVREHDFDLHSAPLPRFRRWLKARIAEAERRPAFRQRLVIRDLEAAHRRPLRERRQRLRTARELYEASAVSAAFERADADVVNMQRAVAGLADAVDRGDADPAKLADFRTRLAEAEARREELLGDPLRRRLDRAEASIASFERETGLAAAREELTQLDQSRGSSSNVSGETFETAASRAVAGLVLPGLDPPGAAILHGVTLGCARGELDQVLVASTGAEEPVRVLAVVEAKRNINDLAHGFTMRQENLAWFAGDRGGYEAPKYRTDRYPDGHFEGVTEHHEGGRGYRFDPNSFAVFADRAADEPWLADLYFVTEERPLLGMTSGDLAMLLNLVSGDPRFAPDSDTKLRRCQTRAKGAIDDFQALDVLRLYAERRLENIIFA